jgi:hypothetical protein
MKSVTRRREYVRAAWMLLWLIPLAVACALVAAWWIVDERLATEPWPQPRPKRKETSLAA